MIFKICDKHGKTQFVKRSDNGVRCKKCAVDAVVKRRKKVKQLAVDYKGGKCSKCDYKKCIDALEFHHIDPKEKDFNISRKGHCTNWERIKLELDKCILVCANCHREIHNN